MTTLRPGSTIVVAGGAGFIGSHVCDRLLEDGYRVVAVDDLSTGNAHNISHRSFDEAFTFVEGDIVADETVKSLEEAAGRQEVSAVMNFCESRIASCVSRAPPRHACSWFSWYVEPH